MGLAPVLAPAIARAQGAPRRQAEPSTSTSQGLPPIVFVHGNGDSSALWINNLWRFEANGFRRNQLFAIDFAPPNARSDDSKAQPNRSSTEDQLRELSNYVAQVRKATRRPKVVLIASSRGGNTVRNFLKNGGGVEAIDRKSTRLNSSHT